MKDAKNNFLLVLSGALCGFVNGFFGGGGGMVIVPLLVYACKYTQKNAHATALAVMLPVCAVSGIIYALNGSFEFSVLLPVASGLVGGGLLGALFLKKLSNKWINYVFTAIVFAAGIKMLFF